ncbi:MAG: ABC transporter substrate-binding protein [Roseibium sp.]|uniref:ABC transporter substrate-binding protein n=1 Tax=Roseibium sp. TaxID=1936156 RepID=UPI00262F419C|nr:ABC transporter substrate-binding protein [Roseibium sp.]MCV0424688.1 ABC transporter substrate-binding protein [Roseibium sp.]
MQGKTMIARLLCFCFACFFSFVVQAADFSVTFINPGGKTGFWGEVSRAMKAAAIDLDADLEILYADRQPYAMEELLQQRLEQGNLPDYFVLVNENQAGARLMQLMAGQPSKVFFLLNRLTLQQRTILESRSIDLHNIVGSVVPDNEIAGYEMALSLFEKVQEREPENKAIRLLALTGDTTTPAGLQRELGMLRAVADHRNVRLVHAIPVNWDEETAYQRTRDVLARTQVDVVWAANDAIAFGAQSAARGADLVPGKDILFAGLNWSQRGMQAVREQTMTMTHGGHFFAGAWALVMLRDHFFRGYDGEVVVNVLFKMSPIRSDNVGLYLSRLGDGNWDKIDFAQFGKSINGNSHYDFSAKAILAAAGS